MILRSQVIKHSLNPFWDQMLIFPPVTLHGTREYIKYLPPEIVLQVFDKDFVSEISFSNLERCLLKNPSEEAIQSSLRERAKEHTREANSK